MTTYRTGNPIGSKDPRDLYDNAENLDEAVNTRTAESWNDRFGVARKTWWGMEQDFQQFLINSGYENIGDYGPGLEITARNQIFWRDGELYRAGANLELPYTTTGDWGDEEGLFVAVGDQSLRQDLANPDVGAKLVSAQIDLPLSRPRTLFDMAQDVTSVFNWFSEAEVNDVRNRVGAIDVGPSLQKAIDSGGNLYAPPGLYLSSGVRFPATGDGSKLGRQFIGTDASVFRAANNTTVLFAKDSSPGRTYNVTLGPLVVQPTDGGNLSSAIDVQGLTHCSFNNIRGVSSESGHGFYALFAIAAYPVLCYFNTFNDTILEGTAGYTKVFHFHNSDQGTIRDSNANTINRPKIFNNTGLAVAIDAVRTYATCINEPYIEYNFEAISIKMGVNTIVTAGAMESNLREFDYTGDGGKVIDGCQVIGTYLGSANPVDFGNSAYGNIWIGVTEAAGACPWVNDSAKRNQRVSLDYSTPASVPVVASSGGEGGEIGFVSNETVQEYSFFTRTKKYLLTRQFSPYASGRQVVKLNLEPGWNVSGVTWGAHRISNSDPTTMHFFGSDGAVQFNLATTDPVILVCLVSVTKE